MGVRVRKLIHRSTDNTLKLSATLDLQRKAGDDNTYFMTVSSEEPVVRWGESEILLHTEKAVNRNPLLEVGAILKNHNPDKIVAKPVSAQIIDRKLVVGFVFGNTEEAKRAKDEVDQGLLKGVSVGGVIEKVKYFPSDGIYQGREYREGTYLVTNWAVREASLTPIPADTTVGINRKQENTSMKTWLKMLKRFSIEDTVFEEGKNYQVEADVLRQLPKDSFTLVEKPDAVRSLDTEDKADIAREAVVSPVDVNQAVRRGIEAERKRIQECTDIAREFDLSSDAVDDIIRSGGSVNDVKDLALSNLAERSKVVSTGTNVTVTQDGSESFAKAAINGMLLRSGRCSDEEKETIRKEGGSDLAGCSMLRLAEKCLERSNRRVPTNSMDLAREALYTDRPIHIARESEAITVGTPDFPLLLANLANKQMLAGSKLAANTWKKWCAKGSANDFKVMSTYDLSQAGQLLEVPEFAGYEDTRFSETRETIQIATYGRTFGISRQAIINDDLNAFTKIPFNMGLRASSLPNELAVGILNGNGTMSDSNALFSSAHANLSESTGYALDTVAHAIAGIKNLAKLMMQQKAYMNADTAEVNLGVDVAPYVILVPTENYFNALSATSTTIQGTSTVFTDSNPARGLAPVVPERLLENTNITGYSSSAYYIFANPMLAPVIEMAFLNGVETPFMEQTENTGRSPDGILFKVRLDVGGAITGYRGAVKESGV